MRALKTKDLFSMGRIISKTNIKADLRAIAEGKDDKMSKGIDFILAIVTNVSDKAVERELYAFIADVLEDDEENIINSDPFVLLERLTKGEGSKQWADFFTKVYQLIAAR